MSDLPTAALREYLLAFADDEHLMGQQHTEWIGVAPFLEEDLAFSSIGQDELGHAVLLYELVCELDGVEPTDAAIDALAYGRTAAEYRSCEFTEYVTTDWAQALVRHWIYDMVEEMRWGLVADSSYAPLAAVAERVAREESYHRRHADALLDALLPSPEANAKILAAVEVLMHKATTLTWATNEEHELVGAGVTADYHRTLFHPMNDAVQARFGTSISNRDLQEFSRGDQRSEHFGPLMNRMREVIELDLTASW